MMSKKNSNLLWRQKNPDYNKKPKKVKEPETKTLTIKEEDTTGWSPEAKAFYENLLNNRRQTKSKMLE